MSECTNNSSIKSAVEAHLGLFDLGYHSHYLVALEEARYLSGRNIKTGVYNKDHSYIGFLGLLGYLCIIDHLSGVFSNKQPKQIVQDPKLKAFKKFLFEFTNLQENEISALYGLRCCLAHDFSLAHTDARNMYIFTIVRSNTAPLITHSQKAWDGKFRDASDPIEPYRTTVNMVKVCDLVETIHALLINLHKTQELNCIVNNPQMELMSRYAFILRASP